MDQSPAQFALCQIDHADLTAAQYRAARRLLDVAGLTGHAKLTREACAERCGTTSEGATRRLLGSLQQAGLIHYSTNGFVYIDFTAWSANGQQWLAEPNEPLTVVQKSDHPRADLARTRALLDHAEIEESPADDEPAKKSDHPRADLARTRALLDHPRADLDHNDPATYTRVRKRGVCLFVDPILSNQEDTNKQTPDPEETALAFALLSFIRVKAPVAKELASQHSLQTIREAISHWWFNRKSMNGSFEETPGIVVYWLTNWDAAGVPALSPHFKRSSLYQDFRTQAEMAADRQVEAELAPIVTPPVSIPDPAMTATPADPHAEVWDEVLAELKVTMPPATFGQWVNGCTVRTVAGGTWQITVPNAAALDWLRNRLAHKIQRILARIINQTVSVEFCLEAS